MTNVDLLTQPKRKAGKAIAIQAAPASLLEVIANAARDPNVDVQKMQALLKMKQEEEDRQSEIIFNNALAEAKEKIPIIVKDGKGDRNMGYAKLETVSKTIDPVLKANGFTIQYSMADCPMVDCYRIVAELRHKAGYKKQYFADIPVSITGPAGKPIMSKAQGAGSAISYGRRYLKLMIFDINIVGEDNDGAGAKEPLTADQLKNLKEAIKFADANVTKFCDYFKIETVDDMPKARLAEAMRLLQEKRS